MTPIQPSAAAPAAPVVRRRLAGVPLAFISALLVACATAPGPREVGVRPAPPATGGDAGAPGDGLSREFHADFAKADGRARAIVYWMQCVSTVARLRADGAFGAAARAPRAVHCERTDDGIPIGGVYDIDSAFRAVRRLDLVRLDGARPKYTGPLDTARIAREARLARDVHKVVASTWARRNRPFSVAPIAVGGAVEAWVIPRASKARSYVTGGDMGYTEGATGEASPRLVDDRSATWTQLTLPSSGVLTIYSSVRDVPAVADLVTARYHTDLGREVRVSTPAATSALVAGLDSATGARVVWKHAPRR